MKPKCLSSTFTFNNLNRGPVFGVKAHQNKKGTYLAGVERLAGVLGQPVKHRLCGDERNNQTCAILVARSY